MMNVFAITPTGHRPEGMALLGEYLNAQNYQGDIDWIIVDDCDPPTRLPRMRAGITIDLIRPEWRWTPGANTQVKCMTKALQRVPDDAVLFVFEDDDIYLPRYTDTMLAEINNCDLIGEKDSRYYNVATRKCRVIPGKVHASLASTVCKGAGLEHFRSVCDTGIQRMFDVTLWKTFKGNKRLLPHHNVVGIKGLPGRPGIGVGHRTAFGSIDIDDTLRRWAGDYADNYDIFGRAA